MTEHKMNGIELLQYLAECSAKYGKDNVRVIEGEDGKVHIDTMNWVNEKKHTDGHFWVENDKGEIINDITIQDHFKRFEAKGDVGVYLYANPADEARYIKEKYETITYKNIRNYNDEAEYYKQLEKKGFHNCDCFQNATYTAYKTGGRVRFGFAGALKKSGWIYWFFGHPQNTYEQFEGNADAEFADIPNTHETHISSHPQLVAQMEKKKTEKEAKEKQLREYQEKKRKDNLKKMEQRADKAEKELFAMLEKEDKQNKNKKSKKSKK